MLKCEYSITYSEYNRRKVSNEVLGTINRQMGIEIIKKTNKECFCRLNLHAIIMQDKVEESVEEYKWQVMEKKCTTLNGFLFWAPVSSNI